MMAKVSLLVAVVTLLVVPAAHGGVGQAGQGGLHAQAGQVNPDVEATLGARIGQTTDIGWAIAEQMRAAMANENALGASVGMPDSVLSKLTTERETVGAGVGLSEQIQNRLMAQNAWGEAAAMPEPIREFLVNRKTVAAAIGIPSVVRERLMGTQAAE